MTREIVNPTDEELCDLMCGKPEDDETVDNVNHPKHYADGCCVECIDAMILGWGYRNTCIHCQITAFKYLWRWKNKNGVEDLQKAEWYINKAEELNKKAYDDEYRQKICMLKKMLNKALEELG